MSRIKTKVYRIPVPETAGKPQRPVRIAVIGDLHNRVFGEGNHKLVDVILKQYPDVIFSVGDLTVVKPAKEVQLDVGMSLLKRLACDCPVYCINGNHEMRTKVWPETYPGIYERLRRGLQKPDICFLEDACADLELGGVRLSVFGLELPLVYYKKFSRDFVTAEEIREHIGEPKAQRFNILLAHNPVYFESYALWGADLTLSGHLHGGSVRLPFAGGVISPQLKLFPKYDYGMFEKYKSRMVVTSGLGSHSIAFRFNNPPEVVMLELY